ncbi:Uncharacterized protein SCF082_LOCUS50966 [Durusdinium trenchii]|uniref:Uncharacterized protein n=1 Tax=Durusdinium trenchii TaxID=1381693 RepID=A0ABP0SBI6_9DINO
MKELDTAPPIQTRMYQELSNGMLGFNNCLKIADVPFPLPFAQLLLMSLVAFSLLIPLYVIVFTKSLVVGPVLCFFLFESLWCMNEVAKELENPFGQERQEKPQSAQPIVTLQHTFYTCTNRWLSTMIGSQSFLFFIRFLRLGLGCPAMSFVQIKCMGVYRNREAPTNQPGF